MKFPGQRKSKHYFPVSERGRVSFEERAEGTQVYIVGIDQLLVDIEAHVAEPRLQVLGIPKGESVLLPDEIVDRVYRELKASGGVFGEFARGAIGNRLHNYSVLVDDVSPGRSRSTRTSTRTTVGRA